MTYYIAIQEDRPRSAAFGARPAATALHGAPGVRGLVADRGPIVYDEYASADAAHSAITSGLTKADLVALGDDFGLTLSDSSLKSELLDAIRAHLEGLAT
jgi:hypothetical protein